MTDDELNRSIDSIQERFESVNRLYIRKVAEQIAKIGEMNQSSINRLVVMAEVTSDVEEITDALMEATAMTKPKVLALYDRAMKETYTDERFKRAFQAGLTVPTVKRARLSNLTRSIAMQTMQTLDNLSNTTAVRQSYQKTIDKAVLAVSSGLTSYTAVIRDTVRSLGYSGLQVNYASGYHRRLDTAVRQNIVDATRQITQHCADAIGESLNYDAVELSAHMHSAPDHEPVQGRVFLRGEFNKMQAGLPFTDADGNSYKGFKRPIGEWNCMHFASPFSTIYSKRQYSNEKLAEWAKKNNDGCDIDGKHYTTYQAQQLMRKIETEVRRWKDTAVAAQYANDDVLRRQCQSNINALVAKYGQISSVSGLTEHRNRMTVEGFKPLKMANKAR